MRHPGSRFSLMLWAISLIALTAACQPATDSKANSNAIANTNNRLANANTANTNASTESATDSGPSINTREPDKYSATLVFTVETAGREKAIGIPPLSARVARSGDDRRIEFNLPDGSPLVYVDHNNRHYVIFPARKQYAELSPEATGIQLQKLVTPGQLVEDLKNVKGVKRVGEETMNGRVAEKYGYSTATDTKTQAGQVNTQAFVYVDKETGLPLRAELESESSGEVKGVKSARVVAEMKDIKTDIEAALFEVPAGYSQVPPEKLRQQVDALTSALGTALKAMMGALRTPAASPPVASPSPKS